MDNKYKYIATNNNPGLTDVILNNADKISPHLLRFNDNPKISKLLTVEELGEINIKLCTNPGIAGEIIKLMKPDDYIFGCNTNSGLVEFFVEVAKKDDNWIPELASNPDPKLTDTIKDFFLKVVKSGANSTDIKRFYRKLSANTNPRLAELIMLKPEWDIVSGNPNIGLAKFIINNEGKLNKSMLIANTNPELAPLIIKQCRPETIKFLLQNSNPGLTEFIRNTIKHPCDYNLFGLSRNQNPELADLIISIGEVDFSNNNPGLTDYIKSKF